MSDIILLTGATGLLGRYLLRDLTLRGTPMAVLVRGDRRQSADARVDAIMAGWEESLGRPLRRPYVLDGDLTAPGLGLDGDDLRWVSRHCGQVLHNGASLTFHGADRGRDPWLTNLTGTANVLDVCREAGVRSFHHVSTAYVCGVRSDRVAEDETPRPATYRNDYEASKAEAERLVRAAEFPGGVTVYRPAVIVGDSATGFTSTYHGLYLYLQYLVLMSRYAQHRPDGGWDLPVPPRPDRRRAAKPGARQLGIGRHDGHPRPPASPRADVPPHARPGGDGARAGGRHGRLLRLYRRPLHRPRGARTATDLNDTEVQFYEFVSQYELYWTSEPQFDATNTRAAVPDRPCPVIDAAMVRRLIDFAIRDDWGRSARKKRPVAKAAAS